MRYTWVCTAEAVVLTKSATSSPCFALTWLAKPSSAWSGCTWLQIQLRVPVFLFSAISQGAVGTMTPPASVVVCTAGTLACVWCRACAGGFLALCPRRPSRPAAAPAAPSAESCRNWRRSIGFPSVGFPSVGFSEPGCPNSEADGGVGSAPPSGGRACTLRVYLRVAGTPGVGPVTRTLPDHLPFRRELGEIAPRGAAPAP